MYALNCTLSEKISVAESEDVGQDTYLSKWKDRMLKKIQMVWSCKHMGLSQRSMQMRISGQKNY